MNLALTIINFIGVGLLIGLCSMQWKHDGELSHARSQLEQVRTEQTAKIAEQDATLKTNTLELDETHQHLTGSESALKETQAKLAMLTRQHEQSELQREQLVKDNAQQRQTIDKWTKAAAERDAALKQSGELAQKAQADRNEAVVKFNDLVTKYNEAVKELGSQRSRG